MRPVNLIPAEQRRGDQAPTRTGPLAYLVVGALALALAGVTYAVLTGNKISDRKAEVERLQVQNAAVQDRVDALEGYTSFREVRDARVAAVTSLADSRFDWTRVMRELSRVLPDDVWLTDLTGTVRPDVTVVGATDVGIRDGAAGPALEIVGCGASQEAVAGFAAALRDIDGVTRVGVSSSKLPSASSTGGTGGSSAGSTSGATDSGGDCQTRDFIAKFEMVAAFDAAPVAAPATAAAGTPAPAAPAPAAPAPSESGTTPASSGDAQASTSSATPTGSEGG